MITNNVNRADCQRNIEKFSSLQMLEYNEYNSNKSLKELPLSIFNICRLILKYFGKNIYAQIEGDFHFSGKFYNPIKFH